MTADGWAAGRLGGARRAVVSCQGLLDGWAICAAAAERGYDVKAVISRADALIFEADDVGDVAGDVV